MEGVPGYEEWQVPLNKDCLNFEGYPEKDVEFALFMAPVNVLNLCF